MIISELMSKSIPNDGKENLSKKRDRLNFLDNEFTVCRPSFGGCDRLGPWVDGKRGGSPGASAAEVADP